MLNLLGTSYLTSWKIFVNEGIFVLILNYFIIKDANFARFYPLQKIKKILHNVSGRPVISNSGYYTENISSFLDFHLQPIAKKVNSYIKGTNDFLKKFCSLTNLPENSYVR